MTEAELLHHEPTNVTRRLSPASAAREAVAANLDLAAADRRVAAGWPAARAALRPQIPASGGVETIDRDRAESSFGLQPAWTSAGSFGVSQFLYSDGARAPGRPSSATCRRRASRLARNCGWTSRTAPRSAIWTCCDIDRRDVIEASAARGVAEIALNRLLHRPLEEPFATAEVDLDDPALLANE